MAKCFKCDKILECAVVSDVERDIWEMPCGAVSFHGGSNFGSSVYDSMMDGVSVEILVCDNCLITAKDSDRLREKKYNRSTYEH